MKKANKPARVAEAMAARLDDDDEMLAEYDFSKAEPAPYSKKLQQGATVFVNDEEFVIGAARTWVRVDVDNRALFATKLILANRLYQLKAENDWNVSQVAAAFQISRGKASQFLRGRLRLISVDQLVTWLKNTGFDVQFDLRVRSQSSHKHDPLPKRSTREKRGVALRGSAVV